MMPPALNFQDHSMGSGMTASCRKKGHFYHQVNPIFKQVASCGYVESPEPRIEPGGTWDQLQDRCPLDIELPGYIKLPGIKSTQSLQITDLEWT